MPPPENKKLVLCYTQHKTIKRPGRYALGASRTRGSRQAVVVVSLISTLSAGKLRHRLGLTYLQLGATNKTIGRLFAGNMPLLQAMSPLVNPYSHKLAS